MYRVQHDGSLYLHCSRIGSIGQDSLVLEDNVLSFPCKVSLWLKRGRKSVVFVLAGLSRVARHSDGLTEFCQMNSSRIHSATEAQTFSRKQLIVTHVIRN